MRPSVDGVGDVEAGLGEAAWRPDVGEGAAAAVGDPEAGILAVPAAIDVGVGSVGVVVDGCEGDAGIVSAVAAEEADVVHQRVFAGHPLRADCAGVDAVGVEADAGDDVSPHHAGFQEAAWESRGLEMQALSRECQVGWWWD